MTDPDEFAGVGGSYMLDPETGARTLIQRTEDPVYDPDPEPTITEVPLAEEPAKD